MFEFLMMSGRWAAPALLIAAGLFGQAATAQDDAHAADRRDKRAEFSALVATCDSLAGHPHSETGRADQAGVAFGEIDAAAAVVACRKAHVVFPDHGRTAYNFGRALQAGGDVAGAAEAYRAGLDAGYARAGLGLALLYRDENGLPFGPGDAIAPLTAAAEAGIVDAAYELGWAYANGLGVAEDAAAAVRWYSRAAAHGMPAAQFELGWAAETGRGMTADPALAARWYAQAADAGNLMAANNLGWLYAQGTGVERDPARAVALYRAAAEGGEPVAMGNLAWMLENGIGTAQDIGAAAEWYQTAAEAGEPQSMLALGNLFLLGQGVARDPDTALLWFARARSAGRVEALSYMGEVFEKSQDRHDPERAAAFYLRALQAGDGWPASRMARGWDAETARALQRRLREAGHYQGPIDGIIGGGSRAAMRAVLEASGAGAE